MMRFYGVCLCWFVIYNIVSLCCRAVWLCTHGFVWLWCLLCRAVLLTVRGTVSYPQVLSLTYTTGSIYLQCAHLVTAQ